MKKLSKSQIASLSWAIRKFNEQIEWAEKLGGYVLPEKIKYQDMKDLINSPTDVTSIVKDLSSLDIKKYKKDEGVKIPTFNPESEEVVKQQAVAKLQKNVVSDSDKYRVPTMGAETSSFAKAQIKNILSRKGYKESTKNIAKANYELEKAKIYKENYMKAMEREFKGFKDYDKVVEEMKKTDPLTFYKLVSGTNLEDIKYIYSAQHRRLYFQEQKDIWLAEE